MSFARAERGLLPAKTPPTQSPKRTGGEAVRDGTQEIKNRAKAIADDERVQAAARATKKGAQKAARAVAGIFGMGKDTENTPQNQFGGKRRRKSRRKKRTKRRRKSRRKKRRTKRRRKSRRKRRR